MDYIELTIPVASAEQAEILTAYLADYPFDSFTSEKDRLKAYIPQEQLADCKEQVDALLAEQGISGARYVSIEAQNWNALWESNFEPVDVDGRIYIRAPFHAAPTGGALDVVIMPKMSFGTGHHATTHLMSATVADLNLKGLEGLDMGSGTGVLAIIAAMQGAAHIDAVDIDEWADENCRENICTNGVAEQITPILGDASAIEGRSYDFILANINRNILLADMPRYEATLRNGGTLLMSGILECDIESIRTRAAELGLQPAETRLREGWAMVRVVKP
ncbi:MAG: 50S ribosomal protein L11 methyltransferase [Alistipes sp.]|nr:50S ribosomal protein L11 methyltransferase [Alistipes sp.]